MEQIWKLILMLDGKYEANNLGQIRTTKTKYIKSTYLDSQGYERVGISFNGKDNSMRVHNLVMNAFYGDKPFIKAEINHIDGNKSNNKLENLEWCTPKQNMTHALENDLFPKSENQHTAKYKESDIIEIYKLYKNNHTITEISIIYNDSYTNIHRIIRGERWNRTYKKHFENI